MSSNFSSASSSSGASSRAYSAPRSGPVTPHNEAQEGEIIAPAALAPRARGSSRSAIRGRANLTPGQGRVRLGTLSTQAAEQGRHTQRTARAPSAAPFRGSLGQRKHPSNKQKLTK